MNIAATPKASPEIALLYDGQCPLCTFGAANLKKSIRNISLECIDAREVTTLRREASAAGIDLNEGVAIKIDGKLYHRYEAINLLAPHCTRLNYFTLLYRLFFTSRYTTRLLFPFVKGTRRFLLRLRGRSPIGNLAEDMGAQATYDTAPSKIRQLLASRFSELHSDVQARFAHDPAVGSSIRYRGTMDVTYCSLAGTLFAVATRVIGNPLLPFNAKNVPMEVKLERHSGYQGVYWQRTYHYQHLPAISVVSAKKQHVNGKLMECVGGGFGMELDVYPEDGALHFKSDFYFWQCGKFRLRLPALLSPGQTHVIHENVDPNRFRYTITMRHPWLGVTFYQTGIFGEV